MAASPNGSPRGVVAKVAPAPVDRENGIEGQPPDAADNERYFSAYAYLYHQMSMLEDTARTGAYYEAIEGNPSCFKDKVVLDVGAGSCILSMMAARAGASRVYAVEATDMAQRGQLIVEANGLSDIIRVVQGTMETANIPEKVDVIVSEWMGYMLFRESMLDSVLVARDRYLKPGGSLWPSHATLTLAPVTKVLELQAKKEEMDGEVSHWRDFAESMKQRYKFSFASMEEQFMSEQGKYYLQTASFVKLKPKQTCGQGGTCLTIDLSTVTLDELQAKDGLACECSMVIDRDGPVEGFCGYFDAPFRGSSKNPAQQVVDLQTGPSLGVGTHWGQQAFGFYPPMQAKKGDVLQCKFALKRQKQNHRLLWLEGSYSLIGKGKGGEQRTKDERTQEFFVD